MGTCPKKLFEIACFVDIPVAFSGFYPSIEFDIPKFLLIASIDSMITHFEQN